MARTRARKTRTIGEHDVSAGFGFGPSGDAGGSGAEPFDELGCRSPPGVAVLVRNAAMRASPTRAAEGGVG
jgi:hypothetical protein